jgi:hypothetical protein
MKKLVFLLGFFFILSYASKAQTPVKVDGPVITFEKMEHDYGTIQQAADGNCEYKFKNTGNEPLIISDVRKSCGCTTPTWNKEPILPGKSGVIKVGYDTNRIGPFNKTVTVISNATNPSVELKFGGNVLAKEAAPQK